MKQIIPGRSGLQAIDKGSSFVCAQPTTSPLARLHRGSCAYSNSLSKNNGVKGGFLANRIETVERKPVLILKASSGDGSSPENQGPKAVSLARRFPTIEYTFVLAGFLKILTIGGLAQSAPVETMRTVAGQISPYLMVPVSLVLCFIAKVVVDNNLQESRRFVAAMVAVLVFLYFWLYKILYRYDPSLEAPARTQPNINSPVAKLRADLGDREIGGPDGQGLVLRNPPVDAPQRPVSYGDVDFYESPYASEMGGRPGRPEVSMAELDLRNPLRQYKDN